MSGGMRQRIMIGMALVLNPDLLIADEPTTALDVTVQAQIMELLHELQSETGMGLILITHDLDTLYTICNRVAVLADGKVLVNAPLEEVEKYDHPWVQEYFHGPRGRAAQAAKEKR